MKRLLASLFAVLALSANAQNMGFPTQFGATFPLLAPDGPINTSGYSFATSGGGISQSSGLLRISGGNTVGIFPGGNNYLFDTNNFRPSAAGVVDIGTANTGFKKFYIDYTNTGTVGAVTINKAAGRVNIAAAGTSVVVTNSFATANAEIMAVASVNDGTCWVKSVVPAAGSFTITTNAACTAQTAFSYFIVNTD